MNPSIGVTHPDPENHIEQDAHFCNWKQMCKLVNNHTKNKFATLKMLKSVNDQRRQNALKNVRMDNGGMQ